MNLRHIFILPALLAAMACSDDSPVTPDTPDTPEGPDITNSVEKLVSIDAGQTFQTIAGFGASDCWSPAFVGKSWTSHRAGITELLFFFRDCGRQAERNRPFPMAGESWWRQCRAR